MKIRHAENSDIIPISVIENLSYPSSEGATEEQIWERITAFPQNFYILEDNGRIVSFINGITTDKKDLSDEMYENTGLNKADGKIFMIFSVVTSPEYRGKGYASAVMYSFIADCRKRGIPDIVLTCKDKLIPFYSKFGFKYECVSESVHGSAVWHQMRLKL